MVFCLTGKGGIDFNEVRYSTENIHDYIYNIPAGRVVIDKDKGCLTFKYAWLYMISRTFEIPICNIIQYKLLDFDEEEGHPFITDSPGFFSRCFGSKFRIIEIRFTEGLSTKRVTVKMKKYQPLMRHIEHYAVRTPG